MNYLIDINYLAIGTIIVALNGMENVGRNLRIKYRFRKKNNNKMADPEWSIWPPRSGLQKKIC